MTSAELLALIRRYRLAVVSTVAADGAPQATVVGFAIRDNLGIVFDTLASTRKHQNLKRAPRAALVIGWDDELTFQIEGRADFPTGEALQRMQACYFTVYPDGRERLSWAGITHVRIRPTWIRMSDFKQDPPRIVEVTPHF